MWSVMTVDVASERAKKEGGTRMEAVGVEESIQSTEKAALKNCNSTL